MAGKKKKISKLEYVGMMSSYAEDSLARLRTCITFADDEIIQSKIPCASCEHLIMDHADDHTMKKDWYRVGNCHVKDCSCFGYFEMTNLEWIEWAGRHDKPV